MPEPRTFRFRPRYRALALTAIGVGGTLGTVALVALGAALLPLATGGFGVALGAAYMLSPAWKLEVVVDDAGLEVRGADKQRFRIAWSDVVRVVASPTTHTCHVDGGTPQSSLLVPGDGAPAPYDIEDKPALYDAIIAHVPADKVKIVETLEQERAASAEAKK